MTSRPVIEYYFTFISLWSYMGSHQLQLLAKQTNAQIIYKPIDLAYMFYVSGGIPVKRRSHQRQAYRLLEIERWRRIRDLPIVPEPKCHSVDPSLAHRVLLAAIEEEGYDSGLVHEYVRRAQQTVWVDEANIADPATIVHVANEAGLDGGRLLKRAESEKQFKEKEDALTKEAVERRYFGAPVYVYRDEPFWGQDRLEMLEEVIRSGREAILLPSV
ncbi:hypothetical protein MPDQ_003659 [Monascus purpureus]|uniref:Glutathione S-transferase kappa n=1 Tax=Monascus purpureus TaxID=5098 RepID=A0A507R2V3_MONPU|nr:hypothetical protein MPDQ_003659 [Monascus purpureus]BDD63054.1 hypothetical protein MAP00_008000 [Monascus purpureus]